MGTVLGSSCHPCLACLLVRSCICNEHQLARLVMPLTATRRRTVLVDSSQTNSTVPASSLTPCLSYTPCDTRTEHTVPNLPCPVLSATQNSTAQHSATTARLGKPRR